MKARTFSLGNLAECTPTTTNPSERDTDKHKTTIMEGGGGVGSDLTALSPRIQDISH